MWASRHKNVESSKRSLSGLIVYYLPSWDLVAMCPKLCVLPGGDINEVDDSGNTALISAVRGNHKGAVEVVLEQGLSCTLAFVWKSVDSLMMSWFCACLYRSRHFNTKWERNNSFTLGNRTGTRRYSGNSNWWRCAHLRTEYLQWLSFRFTFNLKSAWFYLDSLIQWSISVFKCVLCCRC